MVINFFKTGVRHLLRSKVFTCINLAGLTLGMTCALLAILFVRDEMSFDRFHQHSDRLYRLNTIITGADGTSQVSGTTGQVQGPAFKAAIPEIDDYVRILGTDGINLTGNNRSFAVRNIYADSGFFRVFSFPLIAGDVRTALTNPFSIVISENTAMKYFGTTDVIGKTMKFEEGRGIEDLKVTGVAKNAPANSSIQFDVLVPFAYLQSMFLDVDWDSHYLTTFILLRPGADARVVGRKLQSKAAHFRFELMPVKDIHLNTRGSAGYGSADEERGLSGVSDIVYSYVLLGIIGFILLMACVNFINLNIAGALKRSKEIGIRKIIGSSSRQIVLQFLAEAAIVCFAAYLLAIGSSKLLLPVFNQVSGKQLSLSFTDDAGFFLDGAVLMLGCVFIAGLYPALLLSLFNPVNALASRQKLSGKNYFGKGLVVFQFTLAIGLVTASCVYYYQMKFISSQDLGYDPSHIIVCHLPPQRADARTFQDFANELSASPAVVSVASGVGTIPGTVVAEGKRLEVRMDAIDANYLGTLKIPLREGRNFYMRDAADSFGSVIVNETFEKAAGWTSAVGHQISDPGEKHSRTIIGVVKDYHYSSLKERIAPEVLRLGYSESIVVRAGDGKTVAALAAIYRAYKEIFPNHYYDYRFLDSDNQAAYQTDRRWEQIVLYAAVIALVICCIGLFGLTMLGTQQRVREIGIRKVLGASIPGIIALLTRDFIKLVFLAILIASPVAWLVMNKWLENFAYRIHPGWGIFVLPASISIFIAFFTISFQSMKAALANPVKSLRSE